MTALDVTRNERLLWSDLSVGDRVGPLHMSLTPATSEAFLAASTTSPEARAYFEDGHHGLLYAHALNTLSDYLTLLQERYGKPMGSGFHARHETIVHNPVPAAGEIVTEGEIVDLYERRGRDYWEMTYQSTCAGQVLVSHRMTASVDRIEQAKPSAGAQSNPGPNAKHPSGSDDTWRDSEKWSLPERSLTAEMFTEFGRQYRLRFGDDGPQRVTTHTSNEVARAAGLPGVAGHAGHYYSWFVELALFRFGPGWMHGGSLEAKFISPIYAGDRISVRASGDDDEATDVALRVTKQDGQLVAVGRMRSPGPKSEI
jgi:hypothetical protein